MQVRLVGFPSCGVAVRELLITDVLSQVSFGLQVHVWPLPVEADLLPGFFIWASLSTAILAPAVRAIAWRGCPQAYTSFWNSILADGVTTKLIPLWALCMHGGGVVMGQGKGTQRQDMAGRSSVIPSF